MNLRLALDSDDFAEFDDLTDEALLELIEAELPRYLVRRLWSKVPIAVLGLVIWAISSVGDGQSPTPVAAPIPRHEAVAEGGDGAVSPTDAGLTSIPTDWPLGPIFPPGIAGSSPAPTAQGPSTGVQQTDPPGPETSPLTVIDGGYSSLTGGTPAEEDPGDGALPIKSAAGRHLKQSFVRLFGTAQILHLQLDKNFASTGADAAEIDACPISTKNWTAVRGQDFTAQPQFDQAACVSGTRQSDGTWTFDLGQVPGGPTRPDGIALVPSGDTGTFDVAFSVRALPQ